MSARARERSYREALGSAAVRSLLGDSGQLYTCRRAHYRDGRQGQMAGSAERGGVQGLWRLRLRHLRRILLSRQEGYRGRRRQYGGRGGALSLQHRRPCDVVHRRDSLRAERILRRAPCASGPMSKYCWNSAIDEILGDGTIRAASRHAAAQETRTRAHFRASRRTASSSPSATPGLRTRRRDQLTLNPNGYVDQAVEPSRGERPAPTVTPGLRGGRALVADEIYRERKAAARR
jgi:hypothetical protein